MPALERAEQALRLGEGTGRGDAGGLVEQQYAVGGCAPPHLATGPLCAPRRRGPRDGLFDEPREARAALDRLVEGEVQLGDGAPGQAMGESGAQETGRALQPFLPFASGGFGAED